MDFLVKFAMDSYKIKKRFKIEFARSLFKSLCTSDKYKDVYDDTTDKITNIICSITDEYPEYTEYILGSD